jgi:hypothetical protein
VPAIYLYQDFVDFRKSYHGLGAIVEQELGRNPFSGELYVFINRHRINQNTLTLYIKTICRLIIFL